VLILKEEEFIGMLDERVAMLSSQVRDGCLLFSLQGSSASYLGKEKPRNAEDSNEGREGLC
jgi:hypothetical protein